MESVLNCQSCKFTFDSINRVPRILPCNKQICSQCAENSKQILGGYIIECECKLRQHNVDKLDDLLISQISLAYLTTTNNNQELEQNINLKEQIEKYKLEQEKEF